MYKQCRVETYSGGRLHERPLRFTWEEKWLEVEEVAAAWQEPGSYFFRVRAAPGFFVLKYHQGRKAWEVRPLRQKEKSF